MEAISVEDLRHRYGEREALAGVSFAVHRGEMFALLGPNGSGKTTLFRVLSTLVCPLSGRAAVLGNDVASCPDAVRRRLGVVFQRPSIDGKLTVRENLTHHGRLYGMSGRSLVARVQEMLCRLGIADRENDRVDTLSAGLQRRAELAKGLLHEPDVLLLDEPSSGLDPGARRDFGQYLRHLRDEAGVTVVLTTHFMEEAERCDRVGILHRGQLVAVDTPDALKASIGGDVVVIQAAEPQALCERIRERFGIAALAVGGTVRIERPHAHEFIAALVEGFSGEIRAVTFGKPTLEDAFIHITGHRFWAPGAEEMGS